MERADPAQQRKAIEMAHRFVRYGIKFVPMPVLDDLEQLVKQAKDRLEKIAIISESKNKE